MALDADNVRVALTGAVYVAPTATTAPVTPTASWAAGWVDLGWLDENGIAEEYADDVQAIKGWQGGATVRKLIKASDATLKFTAIETSNATLTLFHKGDTVSTSGGVSTLNVHSPSADIRAFGFDVIDGDIHTRIIVPTGEVTGRVKGPYKADQASSFEFTITCYPDASGIVLVKISDDAAWEA